MIKLLVIGSSPRSADKHAMHESLEARNKTIRLAYNALSRYRKQFPAWMDADNDMLKNSFE